MLKVWDKFEWDDENKKNGNVQHLREHGIEPCMDERRFDDVYILDGRTDRGRRLRLIFQDKGNRLRAFSSVGS